MKTVQQKVRFNTINFDKWIKPTLNKSKHGALFPNSLRAIICGPSNCGKSNLLLSLLFSPTGVQFNNIYIYSKSLYQDKYRFLSKVLKGLPEIGYYPFGENEEIIPPNDAKNESICIFDDLICKDQDVIRNYFSFSRHKNIDCFYLCQSYTHIKKHLLRDNANFLCVFPTDILNLRHIHSDHVTCDMAFDKFQEICRQCWKEKYGFLTIVKDCDIDKGRYRKNIDQFICI